MTKLPGNKSRGSSSGRPIMVLLDVLGQKWTLRILWELYQTGEPLTFRRLQGACDAVSPTSLNSRLKNLRELRLVELGANGYLVTQKGKELTQTFVELDCWAEEWASSLNKDGT